MYLDSGAGCDGPAQIDPVELMVGRRAAPRLPVQVRARFRVGAQVSDVLVGDISESGARLQMDRPPPSGAEGLFLWEDLTCPCRVVWSDVNACGIHFKQK